MNNISSSIADLLRHSIILDNSYYNSGGGRQRRTQGGYAMWAQSLRSVKSYGFQTVSSDELLPGQIPLYAPGGRGRGYFFIKIYPCCFKFISFVLFVPLFLLNKKI